MRDMIFKDFYSKHGYNKVFLDVWYSKNKNACMYTFIDNRANDLYMADIANHPYSYSIYEFYGDVYKRENGSWKNVFTCEKDKVCPITWKEKMKQYNYTGDILTVDFIDLTSDFKN